MMKELTYADAQQVTGGAAWLAIPAAYLLGYIGGYVGEKYQQYRDQESGTPCGCG